MPASTKPTLGALVHDASEFAIRRMNETGGVSLMIIGHLPDEDQVILQPEHFPSKEIMLAFAKQAFRSWGVERFVSISEAWMVEPKFIGGGIDMNIAPSEHPDRMECLIIAAVGKGGQSVIEIHEIERDWKGGFSGLRKRDFPAAVEVGGAFAEILD